MATEELEPVQGLSFFSTNGGQIPPRLAGRPRPQTIARTDLKKDAEDFTTQLRARWPHVCNSMFICPEGKTGWDIRWFFDEYDFYVQGPSFLFCIVHGIMMENEHRLLEFCSTWSRRHEKQWPLISSLLMSNTVTPEMLFHNDDHIEWGRPFLAKAVEHIRGAYHRAQLQETRDAYANNELKATNSKDDNLANTELYTESGKNHTQAPRTRKSTGNSQNPTHQNSPSGSVINNNFQRESNHSMDMTRYIPQQFAQPRRHIDPTSSAPVSGVKPHQYSTKQIGFYNGSTISNLQVQNFGSLNLPFFAAPQSQPQTFYTLQYPVASSTGPASEALPNWHPNRTGHIPVFLPDQSDRNEFVNFPSRGGGPPRRGGCSRWRGRGRSSAVSARMESNSQALPQLPPSPRGGGFWQRGGNPPSELACQKNNGRFNETSGYGEWYSSANNIPKYEETDTLRTLNANRTISSTKRLEYQSADAAVFHASPQKQRNANNFPPKDVRDARSKGAKPARSKGYVDEAAKNAGRGVSNQVENERDEEFHICKSFIGQKVGHIESLVILHRGSGDKIARENVYSPLASVKSVDNFDPRDGSNTYSGNRLCGYIVRFFSVRDARKVLQKGSIQLNGEYVRIEVPRHYWTTLSCQKHSLQDGTRTWASRKAQIGPTFRNERHKGLLEGSAKMVYSPQDARGGLAPEHVSSALGINCELRQNAKESLDASSEQRSRTPNAMDDGDCSMQARESSASVMLVGSPISKNTHKPKVLRIVDELDLHKHEHANNDACNEEGRPQKDESIQSCENSLRGDMQPSKKQDAEEPHSLAIVQQPSEKSSLSTSQHALYANDEAPPFKDPLLTGATSLLATGERETSLDLRFGSHVLLSEMAEKPPAVDGEGGQLMPSSKLICAEDNVESSDVPNSTKLKKKKKKKGTKQSLDITTCPRVASSLPAEKELDDVQDRLVRITSNNEDKFPSPKSHSPSPVATHTTPTSPAGIEKANWPDFVQNLGSSDSSGSSQLLEKKTEPKKPSLKLIELQRWEAEDQNIRAILDCATLEFKEQWYPKFAEKVEQLLNLESRLADTTAKLNGNEKNTARKALMKKRNTALEAHKTAVEDLVLLHGMIVRADSAKPRSSMNAYPELHKPTASVKPDPSNLRRVRGDGRDSFVPQGSLQGEAVELKLPVQQKISRTTEILNPSRDVTVTSHNFEFEKNSEPKNKADCVEPEKADECFHSRAEKTKCVSNSVDLDIRKTAGAHQINSEMTHQSRTTERAPDSWEEIGQALSDTKEEQDRRLRTLAGTVAQGELTKMPQRGQSASIGTQGTTSLCVGEEWKGKPMSYAKVVARSVEHKPGSEEKLEASREGDSSAPKATQQWRNEWKIGPEGEWGQSGLRMQRED